MLTYVAMLRGINVSGQKPILMEHLRASFETLGFHEIKTYIQSGNIIFQSAKGTPTRLSKQITELILRDFGFSVPVLIKTSKEMKKIVENNPFLNDKSVDLSRLYVTFLSELPKKTVLKNLAALASKRDQFHIIDQEIYLYCPDGYGNTKLSNNAFEKILSVGATTRNWNTVNKLCDMASEISLV